MLNAVARLFWRCVLIPALVVFYMAETVCQHAVEELDHLDDFDNLK